MFLLTLEQARSHLCHVGSVCSSHLGGTTHLVDKRGALEQAWPTFFHLRLVKVLCVFLLTLEQARSHLCHVGSVCSSHLGGTTHLVDKRGALEQAWPTFFYLRLVKVLCVFLLTLEQARSNLRHVGSVCSSHLVDKRGTLEQARPNLCHVFSVKVLCVFLLTLEQARSHLCHVGSVCSSHLGGTTHLVDKRGALEQAWPTFFHLRLVKVLCVFLLTLEQARSNLRHVGSVCSSHLVDKRGTLEQARSNLCHVFSVKVLCVFLLTLEQARSHLCHVGSVCSSHVGGTTHLVDKRGTLEQAWPNLCHVFSVKVLCVFLLTLEQARSHLCHVGSVCSSHLGGTTHLVDKRGTLEQAWPNLCHVFSVKVFSVFHDPICAMSAQCVHPISVVPRISWTNVAPSSKHDPICPMSFQSKSSLCFTIPFVPCRLSVFIPSRWYHASRGQTWSPRASTTQCEPCVFSQSFVCVSLNPRASTIPSVPCRFSVFIPSRWYHSFRGQTWSPRASTTQCVPCLFSQSFVCVSLNA